MPNSLILEPRGGTYTGSVTVGISVKFHDGTICDAKNLSGVDFVMYTLGTVALFYRDPITITQTSTLKATLHVIGFPVFTASETYIIVQPISPPSFSPQEGTDHNYNNGDNFQVILCSEPNTDVFYSTDGSEPSTEYSSPITFVKSTTIRAKACLRGIFGMPLLSSTTSSATYILKTATPSIKPPGGIHYNSPLTISMTSKTKGAKIRCTKDGSALTTATSGEPYAPFRVDKSCTVTARAFRKNFEDSDPASEKYTFKVATPEIQPPSGTYTGNIAVSISCKTAMALLFYTNSQTPSAPPIGTHYTGQFAVFAPTVGTAIVKVTARATRMNFINSKTASVTYILYPAPSTTPTVNPSVATRATVSTGQLRVKSLVR